VSCTSLAFLHLDLLSVVPIPERNLFIPTHPRELPPDEQYLLVCYYENDDQLAWIKTNGLYVFSLRSAESILTLDPKLCLARHLLLCASDNHALPGLWHRVKAGPRLLMDDQLFRLGYPISMIIGEIYVGYDIQQEALFEEYAWEPDRLAKIIPQASKANPFLATLGQILGVEK
jgi:hypothetical protein